MSPPILRTKDGKLRWGKKQNRIGQNKIFPDSRRTRSSPYTNYISNYCRKKVIKEVLTCTN